MGRCSTPGKIPPEWPQQGNAAGGSAPRRGKFLCPPAGAPRTALTAMSRWNVLLFAAGCIRLHLGATERVREWGWGGFGGKKSPGVQTDHCLRPAPEVRDATRGTFFCRERDFLLTVRAATCRSSPAWAVSSVGRASPSHGGGHRFKSCTAHHARSGS